MSEEFGRCRHSNCKYRAHNKDDDISWGNCDYCGITGKSRLMWHRTRGLSEDQADCQLYVSGDRLKMKPETPRIEPREPDIHTTGKLRFPRSKIKEARRGRR